MHGAEQVAGRGIGRLDPPHPALAVAQTALGRLPVEVPVQPGEQALRDLSVDLEPGARLVGANGSARGRPRIPVHRTRVVAERGQRALHRRGELGLQKVALRRGVLVLGQDAGERLADNLVGLALTGHAGQARALADLARRHGCGQAVALGRRLAVALGRQVVEHVGANRIADHAFAAGQHEREIELGGGQASERGLAVPAGRLSLVPLDALAEVVEHGEVVLGLGRAVLGVAPPFAKCAGVVAALIGLVASVLLGPGRRRPAEQQAERQGEPRAPARAAASLVGPARSGLGGHGASRSLMPKVLDIDP